MLNCDVETKHDTHPYPTPRDHTDLLAKHWAEAISKIGPNIVMTGTSTSSHPKHDQASDPHTDYSYIFKSYWRPMTTDELVAQVERKRLLEATQKPTG